MDPFIAWGHMASAILSPATGACVLGWSKGTRRHKLAGYWFVGSMLVLNLTALSIYRLTGRFGPFHVLALVSLAGLTAGFVPVGLKRSVNRWLDLHLEFMAWSYIFVAGLFQLNRHRERLLSRYRRAGDTEGVAPWHMEKR